LLPSLITPVAVNERLVPIVTGTGFEGLMFTPMIPGGVTVTVVVAVKVEYLAVIVVVPVVRVLRIPLLSMVATEGWEEVHWDARVPSRMVPSCNVTAARKPCDSPRNRVGFAGAMVSETGVCVPGLVLIVHPTRGSRAARNIACLQELFIELGPPDLRPGARM
jgi:hypothetical protein